MRKQYAKPKLYAERFALVEHISGGCAYVTYFGNGCPIEEAGMTFFVDANTCSEDVEMLWTGAGVTDTSQRTIQNLSLLNLQCYNSFADFSQLFTSA